MLLSLLKLLPILESAVVHSTDFISWFTEAANALNPADQATAKQALADIQADNDAGHIRLQEKLAVAAAS